MTAPAPHHAPASIPRFRFRRSRNNPASICGPRAKFVGRRSHRLIAGPASRPSSGRVGGVCVPPDGRVDALHIARRRRGRLRRCASAADQERRQCSAERRDDRYVRARRRRAERDGRGTRPPGTPPPPTTPLSTAPAARAPVAAGAPGPALAPPCSCVHLSCASRPALFGPLVRRRRPPPHVCRTAAINLCVLFQALA